MPIAQQQPQKSIKFDVCDTSSLCAVASAMTDSKILETYAVNSRTVIVQTCILRRTYSDHIRMLTDISCTLRQAGRADVNLTVTFVQLVAQESRTTQYLQTCLSQWQLSLTCID